MGGPKSGAGPPLHQAEARAVRIQDAMSGSELAAARYYSCRVGVRVKA